MEEGCSGTWGGGGGGSMRSCLSAAVEEDMEGEFGSWEHPAPSGGGGSIAERRCGFNKSPWVNTNSARFRSVSPLASPAVRSPYLTIPPGLSPAALLDSPVMLPDSQALPSPTTGTIQLPSLGHEIFAPSLATVNGDKEYCEDADSSFMFKPQINPISNPCMQNSGDQDQIQEGFVEQVGFPKPDLKGYTGELPADSDNKTADRKSVSDTRCHLISDQTHQLVEPLKGEEMPSQLLLEGDQTGEFSATGIGRPSEDGYNWRKYGQKQVKGSEFPRSYYKCTHPSCQVKKKVERSLDGQVTQIVYKGSHCHPKPQPTRRSAFGSPYPLNERYDSATDPGSYANIEGGSIWSSHPGSQDSSIDWRVDSLERTPSTSVITEHSDPLSTAQGKQSIMLTDNPELSSTLASQNDDEDGITQGSMSFEEDGDDETESKRRKKESCLIETNPASRAVREPRVVVQTVSEVDILEDGYRWRKYGQKIVKGNPNPRSYYKCTSPGCSVRKHVERASHDLKSVITTYEGKHNHEVPVARNSNHMNSGGSPQSASSVPTSIVLPGSIRIPKCEPHDPDFVPHFDRKLELGGNYLKSGYVGSFTRDSKIGAPPYYEMKLPHLQPMTYSSFGMNPNSIEVHQAIPIMQDLPISFPIGLQKPNLAVAGYDLHHGRPIGSELQSFHGQVPMENGMRFLRLPKQEQENAIYDSHFNTFSNAHGSLNGQTMGRHQSQ